MAQDELTGQTCQGLSDLKVTTYTSVVKGPPNWVAYRLNSSIQIIRIREARKDDNVGQR